MWLSGVKRKAADEDSSSEEDGPMPAAVKPVQNATKVIADDGESSSEEEGPMPAASKSASSSKPH